MSEFRDLEKALGDFRKFVQRLRFCQPKAVGLYHRDSNDGRPVQVSRTEALDCFLRKHPPSYEEFRGKLSEFSPAEKWFDFDEKSWKEECDEGEARGDS